VGETHGNESPKNVFLSRAAAASFNRDQLDTVAQTSESLKLARSEGGIHEFAFVEAGVVKYQPLIA
jgi:hypothetical protein